MMEEFATWLVQTQRKVCVCVCVCVCTLGGRGWRGREWGLFM
jgi:hypothetical protein